MKNALGEQMPQQEAKTADKPVLDEKDAAPQPRVFSANAIYLARTIQVNTLTLSQMADQKASILIGTTFVVFSLAVTKLIGTALTWSMLSLSLTAFASSFFAVLAVLPSTQGARPDDETANALFFGTFAQLDEDAWQASLIDKFRDDEAVLRMMLRDVHQNGRILHERKYRNLSIAYRAFLGGLAITMATYLLETTAGIAS